MSRDNAAKCSCIGECECCSLSKNQAIAVSDMMSFQSGINDLEAPQTDAEDNQQSEGETRKRSNSGSPARSRKFNADKEKVTAARPSTANMNRKTKSTTAKPIPDSAYQPSKTERNWFEAPSSHVFQPHSHRRHFSHHLLDHFSSDDVLRPVERHLLRGEQKDIIPTLQSCEYKDTNFLTEGSPPRTPINRKYLSSRSIRKDQTTSQERKRTATTVKPKTHIAASLWKEPADFRALSQCTVDSSGDESDSRKSLSYLNKYRNESIKGPQKEAKKSKKRHYTRKSLLKSKQNNNETSSIGSNRKSISSKQNANRHGYFASEAKKSLQQTGFLTKTFSSRAKELKTDKKRVSIFSSCIPTASSLRSEQRTSRKQLQNPSLCLNCISKLNDFRDASSQTEMESTESQTTQESQTDSNFIAGLDKAQILEASLYAVPPCVDSSESNSLSTDDSSSLTFDDDDYVAYESSERSLEKQNRGDILTRISQVQSELHHLKEDSGEVMSHDKSEGGSTNILAELNEIVSEIYELYDDFDTDEKDEQSEFNELKKQLQQYKRTCRVLEYELMSADIKSSESSEAGELREEIRLCRQVAVSLNWELQTADEKLKKTDDENNQLRQKLTSSEIQRNILESDVVTLRNTVDQMSLHASSVPMAGTGDATIKSRDSISDLHRQIQFQNEEKKAVLAKLVETDKEKSNLEAQLQQYLNRYGEICSLERSGVDEKEWKNNDLRIRIRMAEDQAGMLGRRVMQLQIENDDLLKKLAATTTVDKDISRRASSSDLQFLEDEVEALRVTLKEIEDENSSLRYELCQSKEREFVIEKKIQNYQTTQTSLKSLKTPTASDKIAAWEISGGSSPQTTRSVSDFTTSGIEFAPVLTAIDESTQTYEIVRPEVALPRQQDAVSSVSLSQQLVEILNPSADVDYLVNQLKNLALATKHLVDESQSQTPRDQSPDEMSFASTDISFPRTRESQQSSGIHSRTARSKDVSEVIVDSDIAPSSWSKFHLLIIVLLVYIIMTSLPPVTLFKFLLLCLYLMII